MYVQRNTHVYIIYHCTLVKQVLINIDIVYSKAWSNAKFKIQAILKVSLVNTFSAERPDKIDRMPTK